MNYFESDNKPSIDRPIPSTPPEIMTENAGWNPACFTIVNNTVNLSDRDLETLGIIRSELIPGQKPREDIPMTFRSKEIRDQATRSRRQGNNWLFAADKPQGKYVHQLRHIFKRLGLENEIKY